MAYYRALSNTVSVHMGTNGKIKIGQQTGFNNHNNEPEKRAAHNKNVNPELTQYNINIIFDGIGNIDTRDISDTQKFEEAFSMRLSKRKMKDSLGRKIKLTGKNVARETLWYPPQNIFEGLHSIDEKRKVLKEFIDDMLPFWQNTFGSNNIIEVSGHLDENFEIEGRPHIHLFTMNILQKEHEWESKKTVKHKNGKKEIVISKHSEGDIFEGTWFGGKDKLKKIKNNYREHCFNCGYEVKLENMTEEERLMTGATFSAEGLKAFQEMMDEREDLNKLNELQNNKGAAITFKKNIIKKQSIELEKRKQIILQKELEIEKQKIEYENRLKVINNDISSLMSTIESLKKETPEKRYLRMTKQENEFLKWQKNGEPDLAKRTKEANKLLQSMINTYFSDEISL